jgi:hypothetical protein
MVKVSAPALHVSEGGKGDILLFPGGAGLAVHSARTFEFDSHLAEKPDARGDEGGLPKTFISCTKSGV